MEATFARWASRTATWVGTPVAFLAAVALIVGWAVLGPVFEFSDTWELVVNTLTTIITFLMVFLIQNTQNRDARALHLKIDELIVGMKSADNAMLDIEELSVHELDALASKYHALAKKVCEHKESKSTGKRVDGARRASYDGGHDANT